MTYALDDNAPIPPSRGTVRGRLVALVIASVLPVWIVAGGLLYVAYDSKRADVIEHLGNLAGAQIASVDRDMATVEAALYSLATSPYLAAGHFDKFRDQALEVCRHYPGISIVLSDRNAMQVVNTLLPPGGAARRRGDPQAVERVFANGQPVFSDMWVGSLTKRPQFAVEIPVMRDGQVIYSLGMNVPAERFRALLETQDFPADMLVAVADSSGHVLARHPHLDEFIGRLARPELLAAMKTAGHGLVRLLSFDGIPQTVAYRRSELSGWVVGVGRADAALLADARRWLVWMLAGAVALSLAGIVLAVRIGGRTARSIKALVAPAQSLGRGEYADIPALDLEETHEVGEALSAASRVLCRQREALAGNAALLERQNDELRIAATAFASQQPIMVTDGDGLILRTNPAFSTTTGYSAGEAVGRRMSLLEADQAGLPGHGAYWPAVQRDGRWQGEMLYRRAGGDTYMAWLSVSAVRRPDGAISNVVGIFEDITERKRTLAELRACENILLFENLEVAGRYNSYVII